ncbi:MAG: N-formylglutamate amidohydrolase [Alphaproteobacteria bacterium]
MSPVAETLLAPDEPPAAIVLPGDAGRGVLLVCCHAANGVPRALGDLGVPAADRERHIAWDIGAAAVTRALSARLGLPAVLSGYTRLAADCNRAPEQPGVMPEESDGTPVPANRSLDDAARARRLAALHAPYHAAIAGELARIEAARDGGGAALVAIHSFTPAMAGVARPWHVGVLWHSDRRLPLPLLARLRREPGLVVGDNEPYDARKGFGYTLGRHAEAAGRPSAMIEVRQDEIGDEAGVLHWSGLLARVLADVLGEAGLFRGA